MIPQIYPLVGSIVEPNAMAAGPFGGARPMGVTLHYTADRDAERVRRVLKEGGLGYHLLIDRDGTVIQTCYFNSRVNHAGKASWRELSPNRWHVAVALLNWGKLSSDGRAWNGTKIPKNEIRKGEHGLWDKTTEAQDHSLMQVLTWFCAMGIDPRNVCGHDECALPLGRKSDPGEILPWTMDEIRQMLESLAH